MGREGMRGKLKEGGMKGKGRKDRVRGKGRRGSDREGYFGVRYIS